MNKPSAVPFVWEIPGKNTFGPTVAIFGGTHGDELPGAEVVRMLLASLGMSNAPFGTAEPREDVTGKLILGLGNPEAILRNTRSASGGRDLNRCFVPEELMSPTRDSDSVDLCRARELAPILRNVDVLLDIHATSSESEPFLCTSNIQPFHKVLASLVPVRYILSDPYNILAKDFKLPVTGTTDYYVNTFGGTDWGMSQRRALGGCGLCYETGQATDMSKLEKVYYSTLRLLYFLGVVARIFPGVAEMVPLLGHDYPKTSFALSASIQAKAHGFKYEKGMEKNWQWVKVGQVVGHYTYSGITEVVPCDGMYLFPRAENKIEAGKNLYYIAQPLD